MTDKITPQSLPVMSGAATTVTASIPWSFRSQAPWTLRHLSREYIDWVLLQTGGNKERAAEILGIDLSTLYRRQRARQE